jgi:hypothetical protein
MNDLIGVPPKMAAFYIYRKVSEADLWIIVRVNPCKFVAHSGMFPCFFGGFLSRLVSSMASA